MRSAMGLTMAWAVVWAGPAAAHECVAAGGHVQCNDGASYIYQGGAVIGSDGSTIIRTPDGVYVGHRHGGGVQYAPVRDPRTGNEAHPGCKKVNGREVCG